jgi:hypothetical protein
MTLKQFSTGLLVAILGTLVTGLAFGGWHIRDYLSNNVAMKEEVLVAAGKADFVLDRQMESTINEIAHLERKRNPTPSELERLRYLREQLQQMRRVRAGK